MLTQFHVSNDPSVTQLHRFYLMHVQLRLLMLMVMVVMAELAVCVCGVQDAHHPQHDGCASGGHL